MTYRAVLGTRYVLRLLAGTLIGRMPSGMVAVSLILWITGGGGSLTTASLLAAFYGLTTSLTQPVKGRLMDRHGQTRVSAPAAVTASSSLLSLPVIGPGGSTWAIGAAVALAGLANPPLESGLRSLWPSVVTDPGQRKVIQALDTGSQGLMYVTGPLLTTWLATAFGADAALAAAAALGLLGTIAVLTSAPSRAWRPGPGPGPEETVEAACPAKRQRLASGGLALLCTGLAALGVSLGGLGVWAAAVAELHQTNWLTGVLPAAFSTGSFLGGLFFARLGRRAAPATQLVCTTALFAVGWLGLLVQPGPQAAIVAAALPGLFLTMVITCGFETIDALAPASRTTEAYSWLILAVGTGQAAGTVLASRLADHLLGLSALPAASAVLAAAVFALSRPVLGPRRRPGRHRRTPIRPRTPLDEGESFMPVKTIWTVIHSCGHEVTHNLSDRAADHRAGFARWLVGRECSDCWKAARDADTVTKEQWLAARRAEEQAAAAQWAEQFDMPPMEGPERALAWGERSRFQLVTAAYTALVSEGFPVKGSVLNLEARVRGLLKVAGPEPEGVPLYDPSSVRVRYGSGHGDQGPQDPG
ncbi:MFS transporter [Streptomyces hydrogenans]|uniref:MFS transporter n=1 Tax=Streptomyces hydrogenans TaxID=1873719 RepID=UPI003624C81E